MFSSNGKEAPKQSAALLGLEAVIFSSCTDADLHEYAFWCDVHEALSISSIMKSYLLYQLERGLLRSLRYEIRHVQYFVT
jgi:hypothetical protein